MSRKTLGQVLMVGGAVLFLLSLVADMIGIGSYPGFNWAQVAGMLVGIAAAGFGFTLGRAKPQEKK